MGRTRTFFASLAGPHMLPGCTRSSSPPDFARRHAAASSRIQLQPGRSLRLKSSLNTTVSAARAAPPKRTAAARTVVTTRMDGSLLFSLSDRGDEGQQRLTGALDE